LKGPADGDVLAQMLDYGPDEVWDREILAQRGLCQLNLDDFHLILDETDRRELDFPWRIPDNGNKVRLFIGYNGYSSHGDLQDNKSIGQLSDE